MIIKMKMIAGCHRNDDSVKAAGTGTSFSVFLKYSSNILNQVKFSETLTNFFTTEDKKIDKDWLPC